MFLQLQKVPALCPFWDVLHETRVSGTVLWSPTNTNSPTYMYISQNCGISNCVCDFHVSGGPPVCMSFWKTCQDSKKMTLPAYTWDVYG